MKSINLMKNVGRFTSPKSPSPIYPQIVCMIYPPKSSSHIWSHGTLYLTSSVKGILGKISIS